MNAREGAERKELACTVGGNANWCSHCGEQHRDSLKNTKNYHLKSRKSDRERQIPYNIIYMWNFKNDTNELIYKTEIDSWT